MKKAGARQHHAISAPRHAQLHGDLRNHIIKLRKQGYRLVADQAARGLRGPRLHAVGKELVPGSAKEPEGTHRSGYSKASENRQHNVPAGLNGMH